MSSYLKEKLSKHTSFFGLRLWILIAAFITLFVLLAFFVIFLCVICYRRRKSYKTPFCLPNPIAPGNYQSPCSTSSLNRRLLPLSISEIEMNSTKPELQPMFSDQLSAHASVTTQESCLADLEPFAKCLPGVPETWSGNHFSLREVEIVTNGFAYENLIGHGDYGVVYRGVLLDDTRVAVKRLLSNSCQTGEFITEAEAIGHVRHKNLVKLLGYCRAEGCRLAYLHEDIEPQIVHQNVKNCNILLDHYWSPKISDVALPRLLGPEHIRVTARSMLKLGYAAQEHASTRLLDKRSDVYSFGVLIMEIVSGRMPVDHNQPQIYLIDWLKSMVANKKIAHVVDPKIPEIPSLKELKRITLIALRCIDPDSDHRPKMGEVLHMLDLRDLLLIDERRIKKEPSLPNYTEDSRTSEQDEDASHLYQGKRKRY